MSQPKDARPLRMPDAGFRISFGPEFSAFTHVFDPEWTLHYGPGLGYWMQVQVAFLRHGMLGLEHGFWGCSGTDMEASVFCFEYNTGISAAVRVLLKPFLAAVVGASVGYSYMDECNVRMDYDYAGDGWYTFPSIKLEVYYRSGLMWYIGSGPLISAHRFSSIDSMSHERVMHDWKFTIRWIWFFGIGWDQTMRASALPEKKGKE